MQTRVFLAYGSIYTGVAGIEGDALSRAFELHAIPGDGLQHDRAREYAALASMADAVYCIDPAGCFTFVNAAFEALTGYTMEELRGTPAARLYVPEAEALFIERRRQVYSGVTVPPYLETVVLRKDGKRLPVELSVSNLIIAGRISGRVAVARDITDRQQAEQALRESEARFRGTFENAAVGIAHVGLNGHWLRANDRLCEITGYAHEELLTRTFQDITYPDDLEADLTHVRQVLAGENATYSTEKRYIRKDGGIVWINLTVSLVRKPSGEPDYFISVIEDITPRKQAEEALHIRARQQQAVAKLGELALRERTLQAVFEHAVAMTAETLEVDYSKVLERLPGGNTMLLRAGVGWQAGLVGQATVSTALDSQAGYTLLSNAPVVVEDLRQETRFSGPPLLIDHGVISGMSCLIRSTDGTPWGVLGVHSTRRIAITPDDVNFLVAVANVLSDAIEREQAEQALRESEARFQLLADASPVLIWVNGPDGCEFVNRPYLEHLGVSSDADVRGYNWAPYVHPDDREAYMRDYLAAAAARLPFAAQCRFRRADGVYRWFQAVGMPRLLPDGTFLGYVGCSFDITESRAAEALLEQRVAERTAALQQAHDDLRREMAERHRMQAALFQQEKLAALGRLLANVAHELNNPLAVAAMQVDNLQEGRGAGAWTEDIELLRQAIERCKGVVQSFLALARQQPPTRRAVSLNAIIGDVLVLLGRTLEVDGIAVERHLADDLPPVWADANQLHHVVANLITNAHQALWETAPPRHLRLITAANTDYSQVILEVADSGPGIPAELQRRVFEPFFTTKPEGVGSGLGLPLCRSIVEGHGGTVQLASQPGQGTTVSVTLPVAASDVLTPEAPLEPAAPSQAQDGAILLIDDEPGIQVALERLLQRAGHDITTAHNGQEGLAALEEHSFEVILCDMRMPDLDGPGFYRELEQRYPHLVSRVIFLTGDALSPEAEAFFAQVDCPRLLKPFKAQEVRQVIQQVLEAR